MEKESLERLTALGHEHRMAVFRLLVRRYPDAVPAGEIATVLDFKSNTLSAYLAALRQAGLITQTRHGTSLRYRVDWSSVRDLIDFVFLDCCRGRPELCLPFPAAHSEGKAAMTGKKLNVLFICAGNSARSVFAESIMRHEAGGLFNAHSAGTHPQSALNPFAVEMLQSKGHDTSGLRAKHLSEFQSADAPQMDFVFTVCDLAANENCATWHGQPITAHWGVADPVKATGTDALKRLAFQQAYGQLRNRILAFAALPFATLDRVSLQREVDDLANGELRHDNLCH